MSKASDVSMTGDNISKTYYITHDFKNELPIEFIYSTNKKYIVFQYCRCTINGYMDNETEVHGNFIQRDQYCDSLIWYANSVPIDNNRKYEYIGTQRKFEIWFTDAIGKKFTPDNFVVFLKLEY